MPRRNNRAGDTYTPLDLTPDDIDRPRPVLSDSPRQARERREKQERDRIERQRAARINGGIDWSVCVIPGCGAHLTGWFGRQQHPNPAWRDHRVALPLCVDHLFVAAAQAKLEEYAPIAVEATERILERKQAKAETLHQAAKKAWLAKTDGEIYYVRVNGLIKVGWSRDFRDRLKAYGPDAEVLALYEATRHDETNLHRQLRPALAKGREWYHDTQILHDFIARALEQHGPPRITSYDWTQPKQIVAGKRVMRSA